MAVDLLAIFTKGLWKKREPGSGSVEILAPIDVQVDVETFEVAVDFIFEED